MRHLTLLLSLFLALGCASPVDPGELTCDDEDCGEYVAWDPEAKFDDSNLTDGPLTFDGACQAGERVTIAAVGDVLLHGPLQRQAVADPDRFRGLWLEAEPLLQQADLTYANLEGPTAPGTNAGGREVADPGLAFDGTVYGSYPQFNYHPTLLDDLMASGVDVVSTANNHSLDRRGRGADLTVDELRTRGLAFTGTIRSGEDRDWVATTDSNGLRIAWIACTYGTNGIPDNNDQVLHCYGHREELLETVRSADARTDVDAVIVTPHWGSEYRATPNEQEVVLGHDLAEAGALVVLGSHPHVTQPWERYVTEDGRETLILYSLGNFVSNQNGLAKRSTLMAHVGLVRTSDGITRISGARYTPMYMLKEGRRELVLLDPSRESYLSSLELTASMYGEFNYHGADDIYLPDPQCDEGWAPRRLSPAFIGDRCRTDVECDFADGRCHGAGFCTTACEGYCPDRSDRPLTFCMEDPNAEGTGMCVSRAAQANDFCDATLGATNSRVTRFVGSSSARADEADVCAPEG